MDETYNGWVLRNVYFEDGEPLMHSEPEWQGLTWEDYQGMSKELANFARAIETKLKEKNHG